jgi:hypothetical protein
LHLLLILGAIGLLFLKAPLRANRIAVTYAVALVVAFLLFCIILRWGPHNSRGQLPLFILFSPVVGLALRYIGDGKARTIVAILLLAALPWVFLNRSRPVLFEVLRGQSTFFTTDYTNIFNTDRISQTFRNRPDWKESYVGAASFVASQRCRAVGLSIAYDDWEYPVWTLLSERGGGPYRIEHVGLTNGSEKMADKGFRPCAVIVVHHLPGSKEAPQEFVDQGRRYLRQWGHGSVHVYVEPGS